MPAKAPISPDDTTDDAILGGRVTVRQPRKGFRVAIDSVLLAASVPARAGDIVMEPGTGVGAAALCLLSRVPDCRVVGLELQSTLATLARHNAARNGVADRFDVVVGDVAAPPAQVAHGGFCQVMMNPPYLEAAHARVPRLPLHASSTIESEVPLERWISFALDMLRPKGRVTLIHRADRLTDILAALRGRAGGIVAFPLWPDHQANHAVRVIVRARKGVATPFRLAAGLVLHEPGGAYTQAVNAVLREGAALDI